MHVPEIEASSLNVADKLKVSAASTYIGNNVTLAGSTLNVANDSFFNNIDTALVKAEQMRAKLNHINIDNENDADEAGIIATFGNDDVHLDIKKSERTVSTQQTVIQKTLFQPGDILRDQYGVIGTVGNTFRETLGTSGVYIQIALEGDTYRGFTYSQLQDDVIPNSYVDAGDTLLTQMTGAWWSTNAFGGQPTPYIGQYVDFVDRPVIDIQHEETITEDVYNATVDGDVLAKKKDSVAYKLPTYFDENDDKLTTVSAPFTISDMKLKKALVAERIDNSTLAFDLKWDDKVGSGGSGTVKHYATTASYLIDAAITDPNNDNYIANDALVIIDDADQDYLIGENE